MAYTFNGSNQYLSMTHPVADVPLTMACWFNSNSATTLQTLITVSNLGGNNYRLQLQGTIAAKPLRLAQQGLNSSNTAATVTVDSTTGYTANTWMHACGVFTSITSRTVYLNGGNNATSTVQNTANYIDRLWFGANSQAAGPLNYFSGAAAEIGIWNTDLTAAEVAILATGIAATRVRPANLVFYAPLIRDLVDLKGARTITNNNTATVSEHTRVYF